MKHLRKQVLAENRDEFIKQVIKEHKLKEIDLSKRSQNHREYYDEAIEMDRAKFIPGLGENGEKAELPRKYQLKLKPFNETTIKEKRHDILSQLIAYNRSLPDSRDAKYAQIFFKNL